MKKKNLKPMIISALLAVGFGATSVGTSFALFTDHADTAINVTAGKVDVSTAITVEAVSSLNSGDTGNVVADNKLSATLSQGGTVAVNNDGTVSIDRMIPGDRVVLKMTNTNASNVAIKHRVTTSSASFVFDGNTKVADTSNYKLGEKLTVKFYSDPDCAAAHLVAKPDKWSNPVNPSADPISTYYIEVVFPDGDNGEIKFGNENEDNIYQNKAADFAFSLEAVQGNAVTANTTYGFADSEPIAAKGQPGDDNYVPAHFVHHIETFEQFKSIADKLNATTPIEKDGVKVFLNNYTEYVLDADIDISELTAPLDAPFRGTIDGQGHKLYANGQAIVGENFVGIFKCYATDSSEVLVNIKNLTLDNIKVVQNGSDRGAGFFFGGINDSSKKNTKATFSNVTINSNCEIDARAKSVGGFAGCAYDLNTLLIENCTCNAKITALGTNVGGFIGTVSNNPVSMKLLNNTFGGNISGTSQVAGLIAQCNFSGEHVVSGNIFRGKVNATDTSSPKVGFFVGHPTSISGYSNNSITNYENGAGVYVVLDIPTEAAAKQTFIENTSNVCDGSQTYTLESGKDIFDYVHKSNVGALNVTLANNEWNVTPYANAAKYTVTLTIQGKAMLHETNTTTADAYNTRGIGVIEQYNDVASLKAGFGRMTRAGYVYNDEVTSFTSSVDSAYADNNRFNFLRVSATGTTVTSVIGGSAYLNKPVKYNNEWVIVISQEDTAISPVGANFEYKIQALNSLNEVIASYTYTDYVGSGMVPYNMAGQQYNHKTVYTAAYNEYVA